MNAARGRPRLFDRSAALERALKVFWEKGYESAQLLDLTQAMGISASSFYASYGTKEKAFCEAVDRYVDTVGVLAVKALEDAPTARAGLRAMLEQTVTTATSVDAGGCLLVLGVVNPQPESRVAWEYLKKTRRKTLSLIRGRLARGVKEGDLPADTPVDDLALHFLGLTQTISFQARDGASRNALRRLIAPALAALPEAANAHAPA
ncbi:TetR/AcrR family transcriptional regulator [Delftia lacustris]|uniref:TetR/AcrR family transcriptional regulator n=1 Tax=Delftia lacustris TaxID=558537 RepID=UPI00193BCEEF|nr:TetR/AcrR family transcriptional regulator [Delftia lacustris]QRI92991.1 TetR/AcrR family transcriptional regulator [Delftia lacustris]